MARRFSRLKRALLRPFRRKQPVSVPDDESRSWSEKGRCEYLKGQIALLDAEIRNLKGEIGPRSSPEGDVRRQLVGARDLRYKSGLLKTEFRRSFPEADLRGPNHTGSGLESPDHRLRIEALRDRYNSKSPDAAAACLSCLADAHPEVRRLAATFLGWIGNEQMASSLTILLRDENAEVRCAAAVALGALGSERTVYMLIRTLMDPEEPVRAAAQAALMRLRPDAVEIDIQQDTESLTPRVKDLLDWWAEARVDGRAGSTAPIQGQYEEKEKEQPRWQRTESTGSL